MSIKRLSGSMVKSVVMMDAQESMEYSFPVMVRLYTHFQMIKIFDSLSSSCNVSIYILLLLTVLIMNHYCDY